MMVSTMTLTGCSRGRDYNQQTIDIIAAIIKATNKEFSKKGIEYPAEALVHRQPGPTEKTGSDLYWRGNNEEYLEISQETWLAYQKGKMQFTGSLGDYYYFSFMLFAEDEGEKTRGGVLFLPDGNKMSLELKKR